MTDSSTPDPLADPFKALGGEGGFDLGGLLQQASQMQSQLEEAQARLAETVVDGSAAGGAVAVTLSGIGDLTGVTIRPGTIDPDDPDSLEELGDLVVAAYRDGKAKADRLAAETMGPLAGGGLPGLGG